jgi:hypothetical protein
MKAELAASDDTTTKHQYTKPELAANENTSQQEGRYTAGFTANGDGTGLPAAYASPVEMPAGAVASELPGRL